MNYIQYYTMATLVLEHMRKEGFIIVNGNIRKLRKRIKMFHSLYRVRIGKIK